MPTWQYMSNSRLRICANKTDIYYLIIIYITNYYGLSRCQLPMMAIFPLLLLSTMKLISSMQGKQNWKRKRRKRLCNGGGRRISGLVLVPVVTINTNSPYPPVQTNWKNQMTRTLIGSGNLGLRQELIMSYHPLLIIVLLLLYKIY